MTRPIGEGRRRVDVLDLIDEGFGVERLEQARALEIGAHDACDVRARRGIADEIRDRDGQRLDVALIDGRPGAPRRPGPTARATPQTPKPISSYRSLPIHCPTIMRRIELQRDVAPLAVAVGRATGKAHTCRSRAAPRLPPHARTRRRNCWSYRSIVAAVRRSRPGSGTARTNRSADRGAARRPAGSSTARSGCAASRRDPSSSRSARRSP